MFLNLNLYLRRTFDCQGNTRTQVDTEHVLSLFIPKPCEVYQKILSFFLYRQGLEAIGSGEVKEKHDGQKVNTEVSWEKSV